MSWDAAPSSSYAFPGLLRHRCDVCGRRAPAPANPKRPWCSFDTDVCDGNLLLNTKPLRSAESAPADAQS